MLILTVFGTVVVSLGIMVLGQLVDKKLESVMILHDYFTVFAVMSGAGFIGLLAFSSERQQGAVNMLKILSIAAAASVFLIDLTGTIGYIEYRLPDPDSAKSKIRQTFPFAHEPMFESMEYMGLLGPMWAGLIAYLAWHYNDRMFTDRAVKSVLMVMISLAIMYALFISLMGIVPTKIASVQG
ncbi:hypothetical protein NWT39_12225 [Nitrososphaera viennensis]|uniref:Uncharacterized protein n=3 Tax=Nitrososphaera viennensis TaxID=1034015 RepID=A0A060HUG1_9ARCH|nr:hypothetical protein [Nitrososphaera viennensis]AIC16742.1 hypothetical protein NVIE_024770 [Nitrososphaera viennensis EN76]UVS68658.1 hypothetical protein NWT39_12225 [Nitrososphaera viennensis]